VSRRVEFAAVATPVCHLLPLRIILLVLRYARVILSIQVGQAPGSSRRTWNRAAYVGFRFSDRLRRAASAKALIFAVELGKPPRQNMLPSHRPFEPRSAIAEQPFGRCVDVFFCANNTQVLFHRGRGGSVTPFTSSINWALDVLVRAVKRSETKTPPRWDPAKFASERAAAFQKTVVFCCLPFLSYPSSSCLLLAEDELTLIADAFALVGSGGLRQGANVRSDLTNKLFVNAFLPPISVLFRGCDCHTFRCHVINIMRQAQVQGAAYGVCHSWQHDTNTLDLKLFLEAALVTQ